MIYPRPGFANADGMHTDLCLSLTTLIWGASTSDLIINTQTNATTESARQRADTGKIARPWIANPIDARDKANAQVCSASGYNVPGRLVRWVGGKPYHKDYAPRNGPKETL